MNNIFQNNAVRFIAHYAYEYYICSSITSFVNYYNKYNTNKITVSEVSKILKRTSKMCENDFVKVDDDWYISIMDEYDYCQEMKKYQVRIAPGMYLKTYC